jgi:predicted GNAT superfamily acetyltransferase
VTTVVEAQAAALQAAAAASVAVAPVATPDELDVLRSTMLGVWGPEIVPPRNLLRGLALSGACLLVARRELEFAGTSELELGEPVGFALGWLGWEGGVHFHSHQVGVSADGRGGGVGLALKLAQRALCLQHGISEMRWTFDPVLFTNARFNLVRLGARVVAFFPHCYGDRVDAFNTGDTTDRIEVSWRLDVPVGGATVRASDGHSLIAVPHDYPALRASDPQAAAVLRGQVGSSFGDVFERGDAVIGLADEGYVIGPPS